MSQPGARRRRRNVRKRRPACQTQSDGWNCTAIISTGILALAPIHAVRSASSIEISNLLLRQPLPRGQPGRSGWEAAQAALRLQRSVGFDAEGADGAVPVVEAE